MSHQTTARPWSTFTEMPGNIWRSVFRNPVPQTDLGRSSTSFTNFFLHVQPVKVHRHSLRMTYTWGLGLISLFLVPDFGGSPACC